MLNRELLANRHFVKLWAGQSVSLFGSLVSRLALPFLVIYTLNASAGQVALLRICELAPGILVGLLAGVWIDRLRRRQVMIFSDLIRGVLVGCLPLLLFWGHLNWIQVYLIAIVVSAFSITFDSAYGAYLPTLVHDSQVTQANAKLSATGAVSEVAGFSLAGALFEWLGGALTLSIDALTFFISACCLMSIRKAEDKPRKEDSDGEPVLQEMAQGLRYLWQSRTLTLMSGVSGIQNIFYGISGTVYLLYISRALKVPPGIQGVLYAVGGIGAFVASAWAESLFKQVRYSKLLILASLAGVVGAALLPLAAGPMWLLSGFILAQQLLGDGADTIFEIGVTSLYQTQTTNTFLGRVGSIWHVITSICLLLGTLIGGELGLHIGLRNTLFVALLIRLIALAVMSLSSLRNLSS